MKTVDSDLRVMLVEDDVRFRNGLAALLDGTPGFACSGAYRSALAALERIPVEQPRLVLVDLELPGMSGVEFLRMCRERHPPVELLVLTGHDQPEFVFPALAAGASGYLLKETAPANLLEAIREVVAGGASMSGQIARMVLNTFRQTPPAKPAAYSLAPRETEVLSLLAEGLSYSEIAGRLFVSVRTVNSHLQHVYRKLHVHSATAAIAKLNRSNDRR